MSALLPSVVRNSHNRRKVNAVALRYYMLYFNMKGQTLVEAFRSVLLDPCTAQLMAGIYVPSCISGQNPKRSIGSSKVSLPDTTTATPPPYSGLQVWYIPSRRPC